MKRHIIAITLVMSAHASGAWAQIHTAVDPVADFDRPFGLGGHSCKQYDDTGKLYIYSEGMPSVSVMSWLQRSDGGTKANVAMPDELLVALPRIPGCLPGKHHAARWVGRTVG